MITRYKEALRKAIEFNPQYINATRDLTILLLGWPKIMGGDKDAGLILLKKLAGMDQATDYLAEAIALFDDNESFEQAEELLLLAINTPETSVSLTAKVRLGELYVDHQQYNKALPLLKQSLNLPRT